MISYTPQTAFTWVECPRDAFQGIHHPIPTPVKLHYYSCLVNVGFDIIDIGSFVSPKAVPQMSDTATLLDSLDLSSSSSKLLIIAANERGVLNALRYPQIQQIGYPLSLSPTFQKNNTHSTIEESVILIEKCLDHTKGAKELILYVSMAFGNPYGEAYSIDLLLQTIEKLKQIGIHTISLADTIGIATPESLANVLKQLPSNSLDITIGLHLHSTYTSSKEKFKMILDSGIKRIDTAFLGMGGCPFAQDTLVGNMPTEILFDILEEKSVPLSLNTKKYKEALSIVSDIKLKYH